MALMGGPRRDLEPHLAEALAEDRAAARRGDHMGPRELDALAAWASDQWERAEERGWGE